MSVYPAHSSDSILPQNIAGVKPPSIGNSMLFHALRYAEIGFHVLPVWGLRNRVCACWKGAKCENGWGKHPLYDKDLDLTHGVYNATVNPDRIRQIWAKHPDANIGLAAGAKSGFLAVDIDAKSGGLKFFDELREKYYGGNLPDTVIAKTGSGGYHILFKYPEWFSIKIRNHVGQLAEGVDIRTDGGLIVAPPSIHVSGGKYEWVPGHSPFEKRLAEMPEGLADLFRRIYKQDLIKSRTEYKGRVWEKDLNSIHSIPEGQRNDTLFRMACSLRAKGASYEDILATIQEMNVRLCTPPLGESEVENIAKSATRYEQGKKPENKNYPLTDAGNAERYADRHGMDVKYNQSFGWLIWDGTKWVIDDTGEVVRRAIETARSILEEAEQIQPISEEKIKRKETLIEYARKSESKNKLLSMLELTKAMPGIAVHTDHFDSTPWLLNLKNGTLDLKTMEFREHRREDMITKIAKVCYDRDADCPLWRQFLREIFDGDEQLIDFVQRAAGYSLSGDTSEQVMFILHGGGKNGKSTFLNTLRALLGDYAQQGANTLLTMKAWGENGGASSEIARLKGARFVTVIETGEGARLNEPLVKQLTGGDPILARHLYREPFEFIPEAKFWMATNHKPLIRGADDGIWRRIRLIPFEVQIPPEKRDPRLPEKLMAELPGILNWALEGLQKWRKDGLPEPEKVNAATQAYRTEMDAIGQFLEECCVLDKNAKVPIADLYQAYTQWCEENGEYQINQRMLTKRLKERGFEQARTGTTRFWRGIGLLDSNSSGYHDYTPPVSARSFKEVAAASEGSKGLVARRVGMEEMVEGEL